ncbi:MAG: hypothetical protein PUP92_16865, partial [Rhizonema sp. PD38]|nr:hypothetical protein [Rhizonema sp. PD38]
GVLYYISIVNFRRKYFMSLGVNFNLVNLLGFIKKHENDLNSDHYQIAVREKGLGVEIVMKYIHGSPKNDEVPIAHIGL